MTTLCHFPLPLPPVPTYDRGQAALAIGGTNATDEQVFACDSDGLLSVFLSTWRHGLTDSPLSAGPSWPPSEWFEPAIQGMDAGHSGVGGSGFCGAITGRDNSVLPSVKIKGFSRTNLGDTSAGAQAAFVLPWADPSFKHFPVCLFDGSDNAVIAVGGGAGTAQAQVFTQTSFGATPDGGLVAAAPAVSVPTAPVGTLGVSDAFALTDHRFVLMAGTGGIFQFHVYNSTAYFLVGYMDPSTYVITWGTWTELPTPGPMGAGLVRDPPNSYLAGSFGTAGTAGFRWVIPSFNVGTGHVDFVCTYYEFDWSTISDSSVVPSRIVNLSAAGECQSPHYTRAPEFFGGIFLGGPGGGFGAGSRGSSLILVDAVSAVTSHTYTLWGGPGDAGSYVESGTANLFFVGCPSQDLGRNYPDALLRASGTRTFALQGSFTLAPCCGVTIIPPTRQFPRDDTQGVSTARVRIGRAQPTSRQHSYRQGFRGTYT